MTYWPWVRGCTLISRCGAPISARWLQRALSLRILSTIGISGRLLGRLRLQGLSFILVKVVQILLLVLIPLHVRQRLDHVGNIWVFGLAVSANA